MSELDKVIAPEPTAAPPESLQALQADAAQAIKRFAHKVLGDQRQCVSGGPTNAEGRALEDRK